MRTPPAFPSHVLAVGVPLHPRSKNDLDEIASSKDAFVAMTTTGIEPATSGSGVQCATIAPHRLTRINRRRHTVTDWGICEVGQDFSIEPVPENPWEKGGPPSRFAGVAQSKQRDGRSTGRTGGDRSGRSSVVPGDCAGRRGREPRAPFRAALCLGLRGRETYVTCERNEGRSHERTAERRCGR